ncbi:119aa long hypothetical protein [Pyrococcus horikoshii OT3]|uniref:Uncharacterized protein n=1 Tax=Pyrococcus horikoshii (strain ATCC 700860 / DSM 12428 / JCM 9974 / NBRC 100139 / OT-3) TaxID=70601 RepID=O50096_PYRHO|nr:119aa long hypothetical protein [Pyrococcus horikoshii OT3]
MIPMVLPSSSIPIASFFAHTPSLIFLSAKAIFLATENINPTASSATLLELAAGALTTSIPFSLAASTSMLSKPTPALAITLSFGALSITLLVTLGLLLTIIASTSLTSSTSLSSSGYSS